MVEIHVLATAELHPKQVVRNIESALSAGMGISIDRRIVSVAQIRADSNGGTDRDAASPLPVPRQPVQPDPVDAHDADQETLPRVEFVRFQARRSDDRCSCDVVLQADGHECTGTGTGPDTLEGRARAAATAVLDAITRLRSGLDLRLEGTNVTQVRGRRFVLVAIRALLDRSRESLAGAAELEHSPEEAAILAALQATNRWAR